MSQLVPITVAHGDGIGPEIMSAVLRVLEAAGARIAPETIEIGEKVYLSGHKAGIAPESWESLRRTKVFLKAPITTPQGSGYKSLNVTIRKSLGLYANVRPNQALHPFVETHFPRLDVVIVRENEEDLYAGIEHRQTDDTYQCLKLITRQGSERIVRYAFEYAVANGRRKVTCLSKDNIMKLTDGLFHKVYDEIGAEYPQIEKEHWIIDIGTALLADQPERFDVIVTSNLYGDIVSDVVAQVAGSVGMAGSSNVGEHCAMFEAIHGSAPDIAGRGIANPSGLLNGALMMLTHIGQNDVAEKLHNAWLCTLEDGIHTGDIASAEFTKQKVGTDGFADAVIERLGREPSIFAPVRYGSGGEGGLKMPPLKPRNRATKALVGIDVFVDDGNTTPDGLGERLVAASTPALELVMISNRGASVWPNGLAETFCVDHWRCRFQARAGRQGGITHQDLLDLLASVHAAGIDFIKTEQLYTFDGERGYALGQGQQ
jgi:isocitrate dehydrogenase